MRYANRNKRPPKRPRPSTHKGDGPWVPGYRRERDGLCGAATVREPDDPRWSPEQADTFVPAICAQGSEHRGWHVSADGYAWNPEDDSEYIILPR